ncbi:threonine ammonia-lyase [Lacibacterium aquatile]|uniref:Threonine ammonia-lyase n=1 Tax=Lacibacterium aquatile TaxID=1168082 RepID=A0ABW5DMR0_9PROT
MDNASGLPVSLADIEAAAERLKGEIVATPTTPAAALLPLVGTSLHLKLETLQRTGSFKERGALNTLKSLSPTEAKRGVIAASAGNHAQGLAYHGTRLGIPVTIVMPAQTPFVKVEKTEGYGAKIVLEGEDFMAAEAEASRLSQESGATLVHPYDDARVIAGQGTIGLEMLAAQPALDTVIVPIGGGGLIGGIATAIKNLRPDIRVVGVQVESFAGMKSVIEGRAAPTGGTTLAEGIAVKSPGHLTRQLVAAYVDEIVTVTEPLIERAIQTLAERQNLVAEGAGASGLAAILADNARWKGRQIGMVVTGGNVDARVLSSILMRGLVRDGRLIRIRAELGDRPGTLALFTQVVAAASGNIVEVVHQRMFLDVSVKNTEIDVVIETRSRSHVAELIAKLIASGFPTRLLDA